MPTGNTTMTDLLKIAKIRVYFLPETNYVAIFMKSPGAHEETGPAPLCIAAAHRTPSYFKHYQTLHGNRTAGRRQGTAASNQAKPVTEEKVVVPARDPGLLTEAGGPSAGSCRRAHLTLPSQQLQGKPLVRASERPGRGGRAAGGMAAGAAPVPLLSCPPAP